MCMISSHNLFQEINMTTVSGKKRKVKAISYCHEFHKPTVEEAEEDRGNYPWSVDKSLLMKRKRLVGLSTDKQNDDVGPICLDDVNNHSFYTNIKEDGQYWWEELPPPVNENAWLTTYNEKGQTFSEYVDTYAGEYRYRQGDTIYLLPIIGIPDASSIPTASWSTHAPSFASLAEWIAAFYNRNCETMSAAYLYPDSNSPMSSYFFHHPEYHLQRKVQARTAELQEEENFNEISGGRGELSRCQVRVQDLLRVLENLKYKSADESTRERCISIVGVTMVDLYSHASDLFVAGFAGRGVSMLSLRRYHPRIVMSDAIWDDYAYHATYHTDNQTYLDSKVDNDSNSRSMKRAHRELVMSPPTLTKVETAEFFRRAGRLITHELGHNYGLEHCIHHHCYMNGSGNLIEDFETPAVECGICLRKLQFRLGFSVIHRYRQLILVYERNHMIKEANWTSERLSILTNDPLPKHSSVIMLDEGDTRESQKHRTTKKRNKLSSNHQIIDLTDET